ncbi:MAG: hypothetical protein KatS3mg105_3048 [Gemmatales bacterium]|nr:MAG: hypothetical protein KatS3mg105_3048 [Gemmatales bacterium]
MYYRFVVSALCGLLLAASAGAQVQVEKVAYKGWKNNLRIKNGDAELIVTLDVGPRIISYRLADGKNVFKEYADQLGKSGEKTWQIRGGHRLWVGPEDLTRTYSPDNGPVQHEILESAPPQIVVTQDDKTYGIRKQMNIQLAMKGSQVRVRHRLTNIGSKPTELAAWALSVMAPGGVEFIPLPPKKPHPGSAKNAKTAEDFAPNFSLAVWPYTDFGDGRWRIGSKYITLKQDAKKGPAKIGLAHTTGWVGYLNAGTLFVKRFDYRKNLLYPDRGSNFETFTNQDMLEVETLGPLTKLAPGKSVDHTETWELFADVKECQTEADIDQHVLPKVGK